MKNAINSRQRVSFPLLSAVLLVLAFGCQEKALLPISLETQNLETEASLNTQNFNTQVSISNPGFESNWAGWVDTDPSSISGNANSGSKSAKITGSGGKFKQNVSVSPNTNYTLSAYVLGKGTIGATISGSNQVNGGTFSNWTKVNLSFNSGSNTTIAIFGRYRGGTGRFDDFSLTAESGNGLEKVSVSSVSASNDDGNVPANTLDGNLGTRWSSNGSGQYITYDLGSVKSISSMKIAWYKGDQRNSYFKIRIGTTTSSLSTVYNASTTGSSGTTLQLETYDFGQVSARYVRITGLGNSSNTWNSVTEAEIWGESGGGSDTTPPGPVSNLVAVTGDSQVSLSWNNPSDLDFDYVNISYNGGSVTTSSENSTIVGLTNGNSYTFTVVAFDGSGNGSSSQSVSATPVGNSGTTPFYIANLQDAWKITLPKDDDNDNDADEIFINASQNDIQSDGSLKDYEDNRYFYTDGTWTYFKCQGNGETTGNSSNPRSELREMTNGGGTQANWDMTTNSTNTLEFTVKIMQTSETRKLSFAQIHAESGSSWDDILRIQVQSNIPYAQVGDAGHIYIMGSGNNDGHDIIISNYTLGDELNMKIVAANNQYKVYRDNVEIYASGTNINSSGNYFKAGNYLQSVTSSGTGGEGIVAFNKILVY
ncbi:MAG: polysaccharide lyase family 7 protein [Cyclobacteriaceae bacterium]|nr:polysaccharide lyase family 7 protein [Cyclobacteriaceae bacterium]